MQLRLVLLLAMLITLPFGNGASAGEPIVLSHRDDPLARIASKIARETFRRIGYDAEFMVLPSERALQAANSGMTSGDLVRMAGIEKQYTNLVQVPVPMMNYDTVAFTTGLNFKVDGWESLRPYSLCILRGMKMAEHATEGMERTFSEDTLSAVKMLRAGRCQVSVLGNIIWPEVDEMKAGPLRSLDPPVSSTPLYLFINKKHVALIGRLTEAMHQMQADGTTPRILDEMERSIQEARKRNALPAN